MSRGSLKASTSRPSSEEDFVSHTQTHPQNVSEAAPHGGAIPQSYLDASIPLNLPPRRSMKMLKDGSDFVWPDTAHILFVKGLQAWKVLTIGSKRTRAPRGEGKTDFLVRYLGIHGVDRTKKQVASHLQVLRTEWRNLDNPILLRLVDETHTRSLSEPSLPPPSISSDPDSASLSVFDGSPDPNDGATMDDDDPQPQYSSTFTPASAPPFHSPGHDIYVSRQHSLPTTMSEVPLRVQSTPDIPWQLDTYSWNNPSNRFTSQQAATCHHQSPTQYSSDTSFKGSSSSHNYTQSTQLLRPSTQDRGFGPNHYHALSSPSLQQHSQQSRKMSSLSRLPAGTSNVQASTPFLTMSSSYNPYSTSSSYPISKQLTSDDDYALGTEPYQPQYSQGHSHPVNSMSSLGSGGTASYDVVEPRMFPNAQSASQSQWNPLNSTFSRRASHPE